VLKDGLLMNAWSPMLFSDEQGKDAAGKLFLTLISVISHISLAKAIFALTIQPSQLALTERLPSELETFMAVLVVWSSDSFGKS
jgi:hypothetical protein